MDRRTFLSLPLAGLAATGRGQRRSAILIWLGGGPSSWDLVDAKPDSPAEIQGPFKAIQTSCPDLVFTDRLPRLSKVAHRLAVVRSVHATSSSHNQAAAEMLEHGGTPVARLLCRSAIGIPYGFVRVPGSWSVDSAHVVADSLFIQWDDEKKTYRPPNLPLTHENWAGRRKLLDSLDKMSTATDKTRKSSAQYDLAFDLLLGGPAMSAFDLPARDVERYGDNALGRAVLIAMRLVQRGAAYVCVNYEGDGDWDQHYHVDENMPEPAGWLDGAVSSLVQDISDGGADASVLCCGEFGRTPVLNGQGGRDHWPQAGFALFAGGGIRPCAYGDTDRTGHIRSRIASTAQLGPTLAAAAGIETPAFQTVSGVLA